ncbi:MAG: hypoxanthine phosphoribosyltransferase [Planctomycetota bacterium]|nr:MAG: hypoxanthine phosphoribosyltransferase [Planctomycetota bacterium]
MSEQSVLRHPEEFEVMIDPERIAERVREMGHELSRDYAGKDLVVVGVLKGSMLFMSDLVRHIALPLTCDFLRVSSYEGGLRSTGVVRFDFDLTQPVRDKHVLVVEDIIDTGLTMSFLLETLRLRGPASVRVATLLDKPEGRRTEVQIDYVGFTIPNRFVIGYGLDLEGRYRNLPYVAAMRTSARES